MGKGETITYQAVRYTPTSVEYLGMHEADSLADAIEYFDVECGGEGIEVFKAE